MDSNFVEILKRKAKSDPDKICYTFLVDGEKEELNITFGDLHRTACSISSLLLKSNAKGERVLLLYPAGLEYICSFFGCLYAGAIAVPAYPPRKNRSIERIEAIIDDSETRFALTNLHILEDINHRGNKALNTVNWIVTDRIDDINTYNEVIINSSDLAFLQYTSGSTGKPKGVMVSHSNLVHNAEMAKQAFNHSNETIFVGWLPLYHDMGLIGNILQPMYLGVRCIFMTPVSFLQKPLRWLEAISRYKGTTSGAPNFAYELCANKITPEQIKTLDLSSWKVAFNGAEPVRAETIEKFSKKFSETGFTKEAFYPCYGMAEATLFISGGMQQDLPVILSFNPNDLEENRAVISNDIDSKEIVSCGYPWLQQEVVIANHETFEELSEGLVGEIWLNGPSITRGYWKNKEETDRIFNAYTKDTKRGPFLRTGDLGFIRNGEIFITGRLKDLIIIRGRNHYPNDIELTVETCHDSLRPGAGAAFSVEEDGEERLIVIQEIEIKDFKNPDIEGISNAIRRAVSETHELQVDTIVLLKPGSIPKTTSGKIQRLASKKYFLSNELSVIGRSSVSENKQEDKANAGNSFLKEALSNMPKEQQVQLMEAYMKHLVSKLLKLKPADVNVKQPLAYLGLDSLMAVEIHNQLIADYGMDISMSRLLEGASIKQLAEECCSLNANADGNSKTETKQEDVLSYNQSALYYVYKTAPENSAYNISTGFILKGNINNKILKESFNELINRHDVFRTLYSAKEGKPFARIQSRIDNFIYETEATSWGKEDVQEYITKSVNTPFDIETKGVIRINLIKTADEELIVLFSVHHIVMDLWSLVVCIDEIRIIYDGKIKKEKLELLQSSVSYQDFTHFQLNFIESEKGKNSLEYWKEQLRGELPVLDMPIVKARPTFQTYNGDLIHLDLNNKTLSGLKEIAKNAETTLFVTLLTSFNVLLYRYTGQNDIIVGTPTSGRMRPDFSNLVGNLVNPVAVRSYPSSELSFLQFQDQVKQTVLKALENQEYPFQLLVEKLQSKREVNRSPIFQVMFVFQQSHRIQNIAPYIMKREGGKMNFGNLSMEAIAIDQKSSQFDLSFIAVESNNGLSISVEYNTDLFERSFISQLCRHYEILINGIIENAQQSISLVPIITSQEKKLILEERNNTEKNYPINKNIHELFEEQVFRTPERIALVFEKIQLTYKELNDRANQLAGFLRKNGVGPDQIVGICMERSVEMVVGLYGIMKAGGAYLPIDPSYPKERLGFLCKDADLKIILTQESRKATIADQTNATLLSLDKDWNILTSENKENLNVNISRANIAYVIYTSGSTGNPKGVMVPHAGLLNRLLWMQDIFKLTLEDSVLQKTPYSFDVSVWEFFWPLITGAKLVVAKPGGHMDPSYLKEIISKENITTIHFVPSMLSVFLDENVSDKCPSLKKVICSGEALTIELQEKFFDRLNAELHNLYGPTEASIDVSHWQCSPADKLKTVPIGRPISNIQLYILNDMLQPVPDGCFGELHIGGVGLAKGYLKRLDLTEQKFIPNPFLNNTRLYKTGDLVRFMPDGNIEFSGRIDHQVKIRGFRIELGEIEERLKQHPLINEVVVIAKNYDDGTKRLVAYFTHGKKQTPSMSEVRNFLKETLPDYMIPSAFVVLNEIPLSPNGKIDRKGLPEPKDDRSNSSRTFVSPRNLTEEVLADIWAEILQVEKVGIYDNFYELGGDSLRSLQIKTKSKNRGIDFSVQQLLHNQTVSELAYEINNSNENHTTAFVPMKPFQLLTNDERQKIPDTVEDAFPLSSLQTGLMFITELQPLSAFYHDIFLYEMQAPFNFECFKQAINLVSLRHPILRTSVSMLSFDRPIQLVHKTAAISVKMEDIRHLDLTEREIWTKEWIEKEKKNYFDWNKAPFIRFNLHRLTDDTFNYVLSFHDSILDGWSGANMNVDVFTHYFALLENKEIIVEPAPAISYRDFVYQEQTIMQSEKSKEYWVQKLNNAPFTKAPRLPKKENDDAIAKSQDHHFEIPKEVFNEVLKFSKKAAFPLKSILLAAHFRMMNLVTGETDLLSGLMCNGRLEETDGDRSLGMHLNAVPFRISLKKGSWIDLIKDVFESEREMLPYRTYPMHMLQNKGGEPLFEFNFNFTHFHVYEKYPFFNEMYQKGYFIDPFHYPLTANFRRIPFRNQLLVALNYNDSALTKEQVEAIAGYYINILKCMVSNPDEDYMQSNLLSEKENSQILGDWNKTEKDYENKDKCLHELFESQVEKTPDSTALIYEGKRFTYHELNNKSNQIAHYLGKLDLGANKIVGVYAERSLEMVIGLLGILKAGGAYLPLDPSYPEERISSMISDSKLNIILTQKKFADVFSGRNINAVIYVDDYDSFNKESKLNPGLKISNLDLAYVIYTSGSTGSPNGVMVHHKGINNRILWMQNQYNLQFNDVVLQKTPFSFDVSVWEFFWPLIAGATMVIAKPEGHKDPTYICDLINKHKVTTLHFVPSMLNAFLESLEAGTCNSIKYVFCSGEALSFSLQQKFFKNLKAKLFNLYGPTEASVDVTHWTCIEDSELNFVPIGFPISNTQMYILDSYLNPVPVGVSGKLYIGGVNLSKGYLNKKELTASKFIISPFNQKEKIYRTGDVARFLPDGSIEFLGREDHQVKIRGHRIELGEIENAISKSGLIKNVSVAVQEDANADKKLIAYIVPGINAQSSECSDLQNLITHEQIMLWKEVFEETYKDPFEEATVFNTMGYNSSYTGLPMNKTEVEDHIQLIAEQIKALNPKKILDVGCGTGILLYQLLDTCEKYVGVDFSENALKQVKDGFKRAPSDLKKISLVNAEVSDLNIVTESDFDVVVINSLLQYSPHVKHLFKVIKNAIDLVKTGGCIFIGTIRDLHLINEFHASVEFNKAPGDLLITDLTDLIKLQIEREDEMFFSREFFNLLPSEFPEITEVKIIPKLNKFDNEFSKFTYDVQLIKGIKTKKEKVSITFNWQNDPVSSSEFKNVIVEKKPAVFLIENYTNGRVQESIHLMEMLNTATEGTTVADIRLVLKNERGGITLNELQQIADELLYNIEVMFSRNSKSTYDILFSKKEGVNVQGCETVENSGFERSALELLVNNPTQRRYKQELIIKCQNDLKNLLPEYMLPSNYLILEQLPLTSSGKVDKKLLPNPKGVMASKTVKYVSPRNEIDKKIVAVWSNILLIPESQISIDANFFDLGGNSLSIIRMRKALMESLNVQVSIPTLFRYPNIRSLMEYFNSNPKNSLNELDLDADVNMRDEILNLINNG